MRLIGITGSIACGKSTVSRELIRRGYPVIDGDSIARELTCSGGSAINEIRSVFGSKYISPDGSMDRRLMGQLVFSDSSAREQLDQLMAPYLQAVTQQRITEVRDRGEDLCFLDMPLLFEKGYDRYCDSVWCVWIPETIQLSRLIARDHLTEEEALARMNAVMSSDQKADLSSVIIDNSGSVENTLDQVDALLQRERERAVSPARRRRNSSVSDAGSFADPSLPDSSSAQIQSDKNVLSFPDADDGFSGMRGSPSSLSGSEIERPDSSRKKRSSRKKEWTLPRWMSAVLISMAVLLGVSFTSQMLMNAYLTRQHDKHVAEQKAIDEHYPLMYEPIIQSIANEYNLSPALIASVIMNESSFRPEARSSVNARGLMQLMPDTAEWIAHKLKYDNYSFELLDQPEVNIRFGCWYLNYLSTLFRGDPLCVICAYHAGQGEISNWLSNPLYSTDGITLVQSSLPDGPTKQYAGRVIRDYGIYQAKYFFQNPASDVTDSVVNN